MSVRGWPASAARWLPFLAGAALLASAALLAAACATGPSHGRANHSHGIVLGDLPIPYEPASAGATSSTVAINVTAGERFSVKVDTSDGPFWWTEQGKPDRRLVGLAGQFNDGHCASGLVGCRVPYFFTLIARHTGTTTMTWVYSTPPCPSQAAGATKACERGAKVRFVIRVY